MNLEKLPFEYTPQIDRYLREMTKYWNECKNHLPIHRIQFTEPLEINSYLLKEDGFSDEEKDTPENEENRYKFIEYLKREQIIQVRDGETTGYQISDDDYIAYPKTFYINVRDIKPVIELQNVFSERTDDIEKDNGRVIFYKRSTQQFICTYKGERTILKFDENQIYFKIMVAIYISSNGYGKTTVSKIKDVFKEKYGMSAENITPNSIQSCLTNSIKPKFKGILPVKDLEIFKWKRGTPILTFNNIESA